MRIGVVFPQAEIGADPGEVRAFAQAAEDMGFAHLLVFDHVMGASAAAYDQKRLQGTYREKHLFHEPMVLFGFLAGVTKRIEFATGVLVLPQRQTALVAKQVAEADVLSGGRVRLGIGTGWNWVEYDCLGKSFKDRGARQEEQIRLLRELWTKPIVDFNGKYEQIPSAGINPMPASPIPIWLGGTAEPVLRRVGKLADGWMPLFPQLIRKGTLGQTWSEEDPKAMVERVRGYAKEAGRDPESIGIECRITYADQTPDDWNKIVETYKDLGATHLSITTMKAGLYGADAHLKAVRHFLKECPLLKA